MAPPTMMGSPGSSGEVILIFQEASAGPSSSTCCGVLFCGGAAKANSDRAAKYSAGVLPKATDSVLRNCLRFMGGMRKLRPASSMAPSPDTSAEFDADDKDARRTAALTKNAQKVSYFFGCSKPHWSHQRLIWRESALDGPRHRTEPSRT